MRFAPLVASLYPKVLTRVTVAVAAVLVASSPAFAQLNFNGTGPGPITFTAGFGLTSLALTPVNGVGPYHFEYEPGTTPIPAFRITNWPDLPPFASAPAARGALIGMALAANAGTHSALIRLTDLGTREQITKTVNVRIGELDVELVPGPDGFQLSGMGEGDSAQMAIWSLGGTAPYDFSIVTTGVPTTLPAGIAGLPAGLVLNTIDPNAGLAAITGIISPGAAGGPYHFFLQVTDGTGMAFRRLFSNNFISKLHLNPFSGLPDRILPLGTFNVPYNQTLTATGCSGPCSFALAGSDALPNGLSLTPGGEISGIPTQVVFDRKVTVAISDSSGEIIRRRVALTILPTVPQALVINTPPLGDFPAGTDRNRWFTARGGRPPYAFSLDIGSVLPEGAYPAILPAAVLGPRGDPDVGVLASAVLAPGSYTVALKVTDSLLATATQSFPLTISELGVLHCCLPPPGSSNIPTVGTEYRQPVFPVGGTPPYTIATVDMLPGLSVDDDGVVSGIPLVAGQSSRFDFVVSDSSPQPKTYFNNESIRVNDFTPTADGTLSSSGGTVSDPATGASIQFPAGALPDSIDVALDVLPTAPHLATPIGFSAGTLFTTITLSPTPPMPFPPGVNLVLPLPAPGLPLGTPIQLFRLDAGTGLLVTAFDTNGAPLVGAVLPGGLTARFQNVARLSTVVGLRPADVTPPTLSVTLSPSEIWPPNHQLTPVTAMISVSDDFDASPRVELVAIVSSESDNGLGDGDTPDDIQGAVMGTNDRSFLLRAERSGRGAGRVYTVTYRAADASGNATTVSEQVVVPHNHGKQE